MSKSREIANIPNDGIDGIDFLQAGVGAVVRNAQDKARETVSVTDFGAVGDGVTDDTAAIQAAFTYANGKGLRVIFPFVSCLVASSITLNNYSDFIIDFGTCDMTYTSGAGVYAYDATQAGNISFFGGNHFGTANLNHFIKTAGSAAAQATAFPTIPTETLWSRQLQFDLGTVFGFDTVFDLGNFTREIWVKGYVTGNITALKLTGKVVNLYATKGTVLYSAIAASQALLIRGDAADATYRYAEGIFLAECILDTVGTAVDVRDVYLLDLSGAQVKSASGTIAIDITKGVCPLTRDIFLSRILVQGSLRIGSGLGSQFLFDLHASDIAFSDTTGTAIDIQANVKGVNIHGVSFSVGVGTARMFSVGATCANIVLSGLNPDLSSYTNAPTINAGSQAGVDWTDKKSAFLVYQATTQSFGATWTKITLDNAISGTPDGWFDAVTNYRYTPAVAGHYQFNGLIQLNTATGSLAVDIYKNGASTGYSVSKGTTTLNVSGHVSRVLYMNGSTDYVELYGNSADGTFGTNTGSVTQLSGVRVSS
jgi:hypothetical protein